MSIQHHNEISRLLGGLEINANGHPINEKGDVTILFYDVNICNSPKMTYCTTT